MVKNQAPAIIGINIGKESFGADNLIHGNNEINGKKKKAYRKGKVLGTKILLHDNKEINCVENRNRNRSSFHEQPTNKKGTC